MRKRETSCPYIAIVPLALMTECFHGLLPVEVILFLKPGPLLPYRVTKCGVIGGAWRPLCLAHLDPHR